MSFIDLDRNIDFSHVKYRRVCCRKPLEIFLSPKMGAQVHIMQVFFFCGTDCVPWNLCKFLLKNSMECTAFHGICLEFHGIFIPWNAILKPWNNNRFVRWSWFLAKQFHSSFVKRSYNWLQDNTKSKKNSLFNQNVQILDFGVFFVPWNDPWNKPWSRLCLWFGDDFGSFVVDSGSTWDRSGINPKSICIDSMSILDSCCLLWKSPLTIKWPMGCSNRLDTTTHQTKSGHLETWKLYRKFYIWR